MRHAHGLLRQMAPSLVLVPCLLGFAPAQVKEAPEQVEALRQLDVPATTEGITLFLQEVGKGKHVLADAQADALIAQLASDKFDTREKASQQLAALPFPPRAKLQQAARSSDLEAAMRAAEVLRKIELRVDPLAVALQLAQQRDIRLARADLLALLPRCETSAAGEAAQALLIARVGPEDVPQVRQWLADKDPRIRAAGVLALAVVLKEKAVPELRKLIESKDEATRIAAVRALVQSGQAIDFHKHAALLDVETQVMVLRMAEQQFRLDNHNKRKGPQVQQEHQRLLDAYANVLAKSKGVTREKKGPANTQHWLELGLDTSKHPEVIMYKIRWFSGEWSAWFVPGFNDREENTGRDARLWGCFNDHEHEVITTTQKEKHRPVKDLP